MIASIRPRSVSELSWNACERAMTIIPSYLIAGNSGPFRGSSS